jgi:hypothetical protein
MTMPSCRESPNPEGRTALCGEFEHQFFTHRRPVNRAAST